MSFIRNRILKSVSTLINSIQTSRGEVILGKSNAGAGFAQEIPIASMNALIGAETAGAAAAAQAHAIQRANHTGTQAHTTITGLGNAATANIGTAEGLIPALGAGGKLASSLLPSIALTETLSVANAAARLALTLAQAQGKIVIEADTGKSYGLVTAGTPATSGDWLQLGDRDITAADISDSTAAGRAILTAADAAAQLALIGAAASGDFLPLAGGTMSGTLNVTTIGNILNTDLVIDAYNDAGDGTHNYFTFNPYGGGLEMPTDSSGLHFDNGSRLRKGITDAGEGGAKGVAMVCSQDYEFKWEAGRLYVMGQDGFTIRVEQFGFTDIPDASDDDTKGYIVGSRRILDDGTAYVCTDATEDAAVWVPQGISLPSVTGIYWPTVGSVAYIEATGATLSMGNVDSINMNSPVSAGDVYANNYYGGVVVSPTAASFPYGINVAEGYNLQVDYIYDAGVPINGISLVDGQLFTYGGSPVLSVNWASRQLVANDGTVVADWSDGLTVRAVTETLGTIGVVTTSHTLDISAQTILSATLTASDSCAFAMPPLVAGKSFTLLLHQDSTTGGGSATFTDVKFAGSTAPTITATAGRMDILTFVCDGNNWYGTIAQDFTP